MKRVVGQGIIVVLAFILQNTVFTTLSFNGVGPNILLIITVFFGFAAGMNNGMMTGVFSGFLCDIFYGSFIGVYSFLFMLLGAFGGAMARVFYQDDVIFPYVTLIVSDGLFGIIYYIFMFLLRGRFDFPDYVQSIIIPEVLYTVFLSVFLIPLLHKFSNYLEMLTFIKEKESDV